MKKYVYNDSLEYVSIGRELGLLDLNIGKYYVLNEVSCDIWKILMKPHSLDSLIGKLIQIYEVDIDKCKIETESSVRSMIEKNILLEL